MANPGRKSIALFIVLSIFSLTIFDWEWPAISHFKFSWAYATGMMAAVAFSMADRFLKHVRSPEFRWWKLIKTHLLAFLIFLPISVFMVLPALGPPKGVWKLDYMLSFLLTYFFITVGPKFIPVDDLWDNFLTPKDDKKTNT
jgi:hypothetical protein